MTATDVVAPAAPETTLPLRERARQASVAAAAAYADRARAQEAAYRAQIVERLKERIADTLDIAVEDAQIVRVGTSSAVASVEGLLIQWSVDSDGRYRRGELSVLRRCERCGEETVPLDFHDLASLGNRLEQAGPHRHMWDCVEREELEPMPDKPREPTTTEELLLAALRDFVQEHASV